jgi:Pyrimidine dimer DNA glycosylase
MMRLWTLHPKYLDRQGLLAVWREGLLAQKVLRGLTRGYTQHPQLQRFKAQSEPVHAIANYLREIQSEATRRGYQFDIQKISVATPVAFIPATEGQLHYEWQHLLQKLQRRDPIRYQQLQEVIPEPHPLFTVVAGTVESWEKVS